MSDTVFYSGMMREAFPAQRYGGAKAAVWAAFRYIAPKVSKSFTERRARAIWEGAARRIDAEEGVVIQQAAIEEARREQRELRQRLSELDEALAVLDEEFFAPHRDALRAHVPGQCFSRAGQGRSMGGVRGVDSTGNGE